MTERLSEDAIVVRSGQKPVGLHMQRKMAYHPSGIYGLSVESAEGLSVEELSSVIPHGQTGVSTVGAIRAAGGDVVKTSGQSPNHATLDGLSGDEASRLLTPTIRNSARQ